LKCSRPVVSIVCHYRQVTSFFLHFYFQFILNGFQNVSRVCCYVQKNEVLFENYNYIKQGEIIYTGQKPYGRLCKMCNILQWILNNSVIQARLPSCYYAHHRDCRPQSRQSAKLLLQSSELGLSQPLSPQRMWPSPRTKGGWGTLACGRGDGEVPIRRLEKKLSTLLPTLWPTVSVVSIVAIVAG